MMRTAKARKTLVLVKKESSQQGNAHSIRREGLRLVARKSAANAKPKLMIAPDCDPTVW
jgi:hypothetical protein